MLIGRGVSVVFQSLYFVILAKLLGSVEYGIYAGAFALVSILSQYSTFGSSTMLLRYVSQDQRRFSLYWGRTLATTVLLGATFTGAVCWIGPHIAKTYSHGLLAAVAASDCLFGQLTIASGCVFQAHQKMHLTALLNGLSNMLRATAAGLLLLNFGHATAGQWIWAVLGVAISNATLSIALVSYQFGPPTFSLRALVSGLAEGAVFAVSESTTNIYNDVDKTMLVHYGMLRGNGIYTMAYRAIDIAMIPVGAMQAAVFPRYFQEAEGGVKKVGLFASRVLRRTAPVSAISALLLWFGAPLIPRLLGEGFSDSVAAIRILFLLPVFRTLQYSAGDALTGSGHQPLRLTVQAIAAVFNFLVNLWMIPRFGWTGAAWSSIATDGMLAASNWGSLHFVQSNGKRCETVPAAA
ncbi:MAG TPA: oligosaccharide flippase family protein [Terriglobales bacterium]|nr:oligosaccharide flippase family protein [Terriglobales bacterium]